MELRERHAHAQAQAKARASARIEIARSEIVQPLRYGCLFGAMVMLVGVVLSSSTGFDRWVCIATLCVPVAVLGVTLGLPLRLRPRLRKRLPRRMRMRVRGGRPRKAVLPRETGSCGTDAQA